MELNFDEIHLNNLFLKRHNTEPFAWRYVENEENFGKRLI